MNNKMQEIKDENTETQEIKDENTETYSCYPIAIYNWNGKADEFNNEYVTICKFDSPDDINDFFKKSWCDYLGDTSCLTDGSFSPDTLYLVYTIVTSSGKRVCAICTFDAFVKDYNRIINDMQEYIENILKYVKERIQKKIKQDE